MDVCSEINENEVEEEAPTLSEVVERSMEEFRPLKRSIDVFSAFQEEASTSLVEVYRRHEVGYFDARERVLNKPVKVGPIIAAEIMFWLKSIRRRMTASPRARNPWFIELKRALPKEIFVVLQEAVLQSPSMFGISVEGLAIKYCEKKRLIRDLAKLAICDTSVIKEQTIKHFKGKRQGCRAEVVVSVEKPCILFYNEKRMEVEISLYYGYWNELHYAFHG